MRHNGIGAAINQHFTQLCTLHYVPTNATADTDRTIIQTNLKCSAPIEMKNDEKERAGLGTIASITLLWTAVPENSVEITEKHRILLNGIDYRIRKVKKWPMINPDYYELHAEDET